MKAPDALAAVAAILKERGADYGDVRCNMAHTADRIGLTLGNKITPAQVCLIMIDLKLARLKETPRHIDSIMDIMGYAAMLAEIITD